MPQICTRMRRAAYALRPFFRTVFHLTIPANSPSSQFSEEGHVSVNKTVKINGWLKDSFISPARLTRGTLECKQAMQTQGRLLHAMWELSSQNTRVVWGQLLTYSMHLSNIDKQLQSLASSSLNIIDGRVLLRPGVRL